MAYQLHLNLQQTAALKNAISFWERKEVQYKAAEFFEFTEEYFLEYYVQTDWDKFIKSAVNEWKEDSLPKKLEAELIHIIKMIGRTIMHWYQYIKHEYKTENVLDCFNKMKWTPYGTPDVVKIFESSWLNNHNLDISVLYEFACHHALENHIDNLWNKIPYNLQYDTYGNNIYCNFDKHILAYWKHCKNNRLPRLMDYLLDAENDFDTEDSDTFDNIYESNCSIEECMLRLSVHQGYSISTKYFWEKLTKEKRDNSVLKCALIVVTCYSNNFDYTSRCNYGRIGDYKTSQHLEICMFLINQMSEDHKKTLFNERLRLRSSYCVTYVDVKDAILRMLLSTWPWQELFIPVLEDMMQYQDDNSEMDCTFLNVITNKMVESHELDDLMELDEYRCLLRQAWIIIPASIKQEFIQFNKILHSMNNLINLCDLDILNLILNDPEMINVRDKLIELGYYVYCQLIMEDEYEKLDQFIETILRSEEEKKEFKQKINIFRDLISKGKFQLADKLLDWQSSTPEERQTLKNDIDHIKFCEDFIRNESYELSNKFLDWKFNTEEEKRKCKDHFKNNPISIKLICEKWKRCKGDINSAKEKCSQLLHWLFESEEEIVLFKKEIIVNFERRQSDVIDFVYFKNIGILYNFIYWCLLDDGNFQLAQHMIQARSMD